MKIRFYLPKFKILYKVLSEDIFLFCLKYQVYRADFSLID